MKTNRIAALDALRGLTLFGILVVNVPFFLMPEGSFGTYAAETFPNWWDKLATFLMHALFEGKFILIFSFLFGWGLHTQMSRGADFKTQYYRRLAGLFIIGLLHAVFLFVGDILVSYAILGIALLWVRDWPPRKLVIGAGAFWLITILCHAGLGAAIAYAPQQEPANYAALVELHRTGSLGDIMSNRVVELITLYAITPIFFMPPVFGMFMLGLAAAKTFAEPGLDTAKPLAKKIIIYGWIPAFILNLAYGAVTVWPMADQVVALVIRAVAMVSLGLVYLAIAALVLTHLKAERLGKYAGGEGRMSLSLYIGESVVMGFIAYSFGLALYGHVGPAGQFGVALAVYLGLLVTSALWLKMFTLGPMEWLLRSIAQAQLLGLR
jgi:uncharacterized protein